MSAEPDLADLGRRRRRLHDLWEQLHADVACTIRQQISESTLRSGELVVTNRLSWLRSPAESRRQAPARRHAPLRARRPDPLS
jgi:hypothetical protein